jgi:hypothetical protein
LHFLLGVGTRSEDSPTPESPKVSPSPSPLIPHPHPHPHPSPFTLHLTLTPHTLTPSPSRLHTLILTPSPSHFHPHPYTLTPLHPYTLTPLHPYTLTPSPLPLTSGEGHNRRGGSMRRLAHRAWGASPIGQQVMSQGGYWVRGKKGYRGKGVIRNTVGYGDFVWDVEFIILYSVHIHSIGCYFVRLSDSIGFYF